MRKPKRLWAPLLLGVLLMATLVGVASARPSARPLEQAWRVLTVPAGDCIPADADDDGTSSSTQIWCDTGFDCEWRCVVHFPAAGEQAVGAVSVKRVTMYAHDNIAGFVTATLWNTYPPSGSGLIMAQTGTVDSPADPQTVIQTSIMSNPVFRSQAPVMYIYMHNGTKVYGFYIHYTW